MGSVIEFPGGNKSEPEKTKESRKVEDAAYVYLCKLDEELVPLFQHEDEEWWGVIAFWKIEDIENGEKALMDVNTVAAFKERPHAVDFACTHAKEARVYPTQELIIEMRMKFCGIEWVPEDDDPSGGKDAGE